MTEPRLRRVFFALFPPAEAAEHLLALGQNLAGPGGGRFISLPSLHLTLIFVGSADPTQIDAMRAVAQDVRANAFDIHLDRLGFWPCGGVMWAGCRNPPAAEYRLFESLRNALDVAGVVPAARSGPSHHIPHVTLARRVRCATLPRLATPLSWHVDEFALVESHLHQAGSRYQILATFPLG